MTKEPEGTRMEVVKGFSELNFDCLVHHLPPNRERQTLVVYWPEWHEDRWRCWWSLEGPNDRVTPPVAALWLRTDGTVSLNLHDVHGDFLCRHKFELPGPTVREFFDQMPGVLGELLVAHLTLLTKKPVSGEAP